MVDQIIALVIYVIVFSLVAYGLLWVCNNFGLPAPVKWICGALLLIILLLFISRYVGVGALSLPPRR